MKIQDGRKSNNIDRLGHLKVQKELEDHKKYGVKRQEWVSPYMEWNIEMELGFFTKNDCWIGYLHHKTIRSQA